MVLGLFGVGVDHSTTALSCDSMLDRKETLSQSEHRLAAMMFTDVVCNTALGQRNESLSLALVEEQRKLIRPILNRREAKRSRRCDA